MCRCRIQGVCACDTFPKPVVIGESLQHVPASSLVAARAGTGSRRLVSRAGSRSRTRHGLLAIVGVVRGESSPVEGRRHPSTSPWRVVLARLGIQTALRGESKFSSQIKNLQQRWGGRLGAGGNDSEKSNPHFTRCKR